VSVVVLLLKIAVTAAVMVVSKVEQMLFLALVALTLVEMSLLSAGATPVMPVVTLLVLVGGGVFNLVYISISFIYVLYTPNSAIIYGNKS
jgi:hypothetical protein